MINLDQQPNSPQQRVVNTDLMKFIPPNAQIVVEFGCGAGNLGAQYKKINPFCRYIGIEVDKEAARLAASRLDVVVTASLEELDLNKVAPDGVDCLVYDNVLTQLKDPWGMLKNHARHLREEGQAIAAIPNIQHWSVLLNLLAGKWDYQQQGLMNINNLRHFTFDSIRQLFTDAGLHVHDIRAIGQLSPQFEEIQKSLAPVLAELGVDQSIFRNRSGALQYIVRAAKKQPTKRVLVQSLLGETLVCSRVRITEPDAFMATIPGVRIVEQTKQASLALANSEEDKIFIWQRVWPNSAEQQKQLLQRGYLILAEIDDDPMRWADYHQKDNFFAFRAAHAVQTSTEALAGFLRNFNPNVAVIPNQVAVLPAPREPRREYPLTLLFGAINREEDWKPIISTLNGLLAEYKDTVTVKVIYDRQFYDALTTPYKEFIPLSPYGAYIQTLSSADIAILPLENTRFNSMKSDLKFLECASCSVAALSGATVYSNTILPGETGLIYRSSAEFGLHLRTLIENHELRSTLVSKAYAWVRENRLLCRHYQARYQWYTSLLDKLPALTEDLLQRVPELR